MNLFLAVLPILVVLVLMIALRWGGQRAGPAGWLVGLVIAALAFGLTFDVLWVSQLKGFFLSMFVLAVMIPALLLYHIIDQTGGIRAMAQALEQTLADRGILLITLAWAFSGMLEGLAGFGLPIAIVAPMLVGLGVEPVLAVAAVAVGHAWSVTFGDMGIIWQTLIGVVKMDSASLAPTAAVLLGVACLLCGLASARILGYTRRAPYVVAIGGLMSATQYALVAIDITPLAAFGAGAAGVLGGIAISIPSGVKPSGMQSKDTQRALFTALFSYGSLAALMSIIFLIPPLRATLDQVMWRMTFPQVSTTTGFITSAGFGQAFRFLTHPGTAILLIAVISLIFYSRAKLCPPKTWRVALAATWQSAAPSSVGIISMVGLAALMDHTGMTLLLARAMSDAMGTTFPIASPLVGMLGAFATGSNNNSNVLFGTLQQNAALLLGIAPNILIAAQTTGGSLGSIIAPAKLLVGCSTVGLKRRDGEVLRITLPYGLFIGLVMGAITLALSKM